MRWRLLFTEAMDGAANMALDEALMQRAGTHGETVLRVYSWAAPTISLGRHQRARGVFDAALLDAQGVALVRRLTGGRAVLHHREVTYSVTGPAPSAASIATVYAAINEVLLAGLRRLGVTATLAGRPPSRDGRIPAPGSAPCFELPMPGEIVLGERKLVGSAQVREDGTLLQHGSILVHDDQGWIARLGAVPLPAAAPAATLHDALGRSPQAAEVAAALFAAVRECADPAAEPLALDGTLADAATRAQRRYEDPLWTWCR